MAQPGSENRRATLALAALSLIWGYNWIVMKLGLTHAGPFDFSALRFGFGALFLLPFMLGRGEKLWPRARQWPALLVLGVLLAFNFGATMSALKLGGVGKTAVLVYAMPFWVLVIARIWLKEKLSRLQIVSVALAGCGLAVLVEPWRLSGQMYPNLLAVGAGLSWGAGVVMVKAIQKARSAPTVMIAFWQMVIAAPLLALAGGAFDEQPVRWSLEFALTLAYVAALASGVAWLLFYYALRRLPAGIAGLGTLATPVIGVMAAWLQLGERPGAVEGAGMALIGFGLASLAWSAPSAVQSGDRPARQTAN